MNMLELKKQRVDSEYFYSYISVGFLTTAGVFGGYLYTLNIGSAWWMVGIMMPTIVSLIMCGALISDAKINGVTFDPEALVDKAIIPSTSIKSLLFSKGFSKVVYYYPDIGRTISPIFSIRAYSNGTAATLIIPFALAFIMYTTQFQTAVLLSLIAITLMWLIFAAINMVSLFALWRKHRNPLTKKNFVNMIFSRKQLGTICRHQRINYYVDESKSVNLLDFIAEEGVSAAYFANLLIESGATDAKTIAGEIAIIEHIVNTFVATTIRATNSFFEKHREKQQAAEQVYLRDVAPQVRTEALELKNKIEQVNCTLRNIEQVHKNTCLRKDEDSISIDNELFALRQSALLPIPQFPEFHQLVFSNMENKVAANNIVNGSLMTLVKAKSLASSDNDCKKIEKQINETKTFVKSLAANTPQSKARQARVLAARKQDPLFLGGNTDSINSLDNIIAIEQRYINDYDNILPADNGRGQEIQN